MNVTDFQFNPDLLEGLYEDLNLGQKMDVQDLVYILLSFPFHEAEWDLEDRICDLLFNIDDEGDEGDDMEGDECGDDCDHDHDHHHH